MPSPNEDPQPVDVSSERFEEVREDFEGALKRFDALRAESRHLDSLGELKSLLEEEDKLPFGKRADLHLRIGAAALMTSDFDAADWHLIEGMLNDARDPHVRNTPFGTRNLNLRYNYAGMLSRDAGNEPSRVIFDQVEGELRKRLADPECSKPDVRQAHRGLLYWTLRDRGVAAASEGDWESGLDHLMAAYQLSEGFDPSARHGRLLILRSLTEGFALRSDFRRAIEFGERSLEEASPEELPIGGVSRAVVEFQLGMSHVNLAQFGKAAPYLESAGEVFDTLDDPSLKQRAFYLKVLTLASHVIEGRGDAARAVKPWLKDRGENLLPEQRGSLLTSAFNLCVGMLSRYHRFDDAERLQEFVENEFTIS